MKKILLIVLVIIIVVPVAVVMTSSLWLNMAVAAAIEGVTGFPTKIDKLDLNFGKTEIGIYGVTIKNPKTFADDRFVSIPEIYVDFYLEPFLEDRNLYLKDVRINIEEVSVVKNQAGVTNLAQLKAVTQPKAEMAKEEQKAQEAKEAKAPQKLDFFVEEMSLTIRRLRYNDQSQPLIGEKLIDLHIENQIFKGISNIADIVRIIVLQITYKAALGNLGVPVDMLKGHLDSTLALGQDLAAQGTKLATEFGTEALGEGQKVLQDAASKIPVNTAEVEKTVDEVGKQAKGLFGSAEKFLKNTADTVGDKVKQ